LTAAEAATEVHRHARTWRVVSLSGETVRHAARGAVEYQIPYWDALVWAAARLAAIPVVLTEDFQDGREIEGVTFQNPFPPRPPESP
jgi:predicted nucleic acid-binding protein